MSYENLERSLKAIALTVPASRAFEMTVKFALNQGRDTSTVFKLEDHFRDRKAMKNCIERMRQDPLARKCIEDRYLGPELDLDALVQYPRGSLGYTYAKVLKEAGLRRALLHRPEEPGRGDRLRDHARSERIKPLMGVRWEDGLDKPLDVWRQELNVEPIRHGPNSWDEVLSDLEL